MKSNCSWCPIPWTSISTTNFGVYRLCVQANSHRESRGILRDAVGDELNAHSVPVPEIRNASLLKEVRKSMLAGIKHPVCERCNVEESTGASSRRRVATEDWATSRELISLEKCIEKTEADGSIRPEDFPIFELELRLGNLCNLMCRSCSPNSSSSWIREWKDLDLQSFQDGHKRVYIQKPSQAGASYGLSVDYSWYESSPLLDSSTDYFKDIKKIHLTGGEPFLIKKHFLFLKELVKRGIAPQVELDYNSNLTILPEQIFELWPLFKRVNLGVSLDGVGEVNDYIRYPSRFSKIEENLRKMDQLPDSVHIWITTTVMNLNVYYIPELVEWVLTSGIKKIARHKTPVVFHHLMNPEYLRIDKLPDEIKQRVNQRYHDFFSNNNLKETRFTDIVPSVQAILQFMNSGQFDPKTWEFFNNRTDVLDKFRSQSFRALPL